MTGPVVKNKRPVIYVGIGILNTALDFAIYTVLTSTIFKSGHHIAVAGFISGTFALICAFLTHSFITWRGSHITHKTIIKFAGFTGFGMWVIRPALLVGFIHFNSLYSLAHRFTNNLGLPFSYNFVANTGAFGFMVIIVLLYNYFVYSQFVFSKQAPGRTGPENHSAS